MPQVVEVRIRPAQLSFRVLRKPPQDVTAEEASRAVRRFLHMKRPALAQALQIEAGSGYVLLRAEGEVPQEMLREACELLESGSLPPVELEVEVDAEEFAVHVDEPPVESLGAREILRSIVRYFPHPVCEWFEITRGLLVLTDQQVTYEPEWLMMQDEAAQRSGRHVIRLDSMLGCGRGEWWDVPCLMIETAGFTYRYGWPAERGELELVFDVDEWLEHLRRLLQDR
jgi:hypothetical protein